MGRQLDRSPALGVGNAPEFADASVPAGDLGLEPVDGQPKPLELLVPPPAALAIPGGVIRQQRGPGTRRDQRPARHRPVRLPEYQVQDTPGEPGGPAALPLQEEGLEQALLQGDGGPFS
jgi:hypothetical protein